MDGIAIQAEAREIVSCLLAAGPGPIDEVAWLAEDQSAGAISLAGWLDQRDCYIWKDKQEHHTDIVVERAGREIIRISASDLFSSKRCPLDGRRA